MPSTVGYVRAILSRDPQHMAAPFAVEVYSPSAQPGKRTERYDLDKVGDNRELVMVSVLRDALVHSLPVHLGFDGSRKISDVEIMSASPYDDWPTETVTGKVTMISIDEGGLGTTNVSNPDLATVVMASDDGTKTEMYLNLERAQPSTKLAQLALLRQAYQEETEVTAKYQKRPISPGKVARVIVGVRAGASYTITKP